MNDIIQPQGGNDVRLDGLRTLTMVTYVLYAVSALVGFTAIVAIIINYIKRDEAAGTIYESHFTWQIRTFWYSLLWGAMGWATVWILIGFLVWAAAGIWFIYRIAKGWVRLTEGKPMYVA